MELIENGNGQKQKQRCEQIGNHPVKQDQPPKPISKREPADKPDKNKAHIDDYEPFPFRF